MKNDSSIRPTMLFTIDERIILYKIGNINKPKLNEVIDAIVDMFET